MTQSDPASVTLFHGLVLLALVALPLYALRVRGRAYAGFGLAILLLSLPGAWVTEARVAGWMPPEARPWVALAFAYGMAAAGLHLAHLVRARLRALPFRIAVSIPGQVFVAAGFLAGVWQLALALARGVAALVGLPDPGAAVSWLDWLPFVVAALSVVTSSRRGIEWVRVPAAEGGPDAVARVPVERYRRRAPAPLSQRALRIVQISDPHLGPWQTVTRLRRTLDALLAHDPDLVLLTGDFLTMEGRGSPGALAAALAPLRSLPGRCFAIFGNHDHEAEREVRSGLAANAVTLLVDQEAVTDTAVGRVQILGADWVPRGRRRHLARLLERHPRRPGLPRLLLLHDPLGFRHLPPGEVDLTLSGHTHGGQIGLVSLGLAWTVLSRSPWPDHGLFGRGTNRLYVHRGTGFYGFPLRVGVPGEFSVLEWLLPSADASAATAETPAQPAPAVP